MSAVGRSGRSAAAPRGAVGARRRTIGGLSAACSRRECGLHAGIAALSLAVTFTAFWSVRGGVEERAAAHFERESSRTVRALTNLMAHHEDALRAGIAAPAVLVQDARDTPGVPFLAPHRGGERAPAGTDAPDGLAHSPLAFADLVSDALPRSERDVDLRLADGDTVIHDELGGNAAARCAPARTVELSMHGRTWRLDMVPANRLVGARSYLQPVLVLLGGLVIDAMIIGLSFSIVRTRRALEHSAEIGAELADRSRELEASNEELERFACTVGHDLKTPLRGIGDLAWYLEEDLEPLLAAGETHPDVPRHLERIGLQTRRMTALIDGILDYSGIGAGDATLEAVDTGALLAKLAELHATHPGQLVVDGPAPVLETSPTRLAQVLGNLVSNAFACHPSPPGALVRVSFEPRGAVWRIRVSDDGPGIDPKYHERIFEMFQTLQPKNATNGTGVGLAIVRRTVEHVGGHVRVESAVGEGATFVVDWPARASTRAHPARVRTPRGPVASDPVLPELPKAA